MAQVCVYAGRSFSERLQSGGKAGGDLAFVPVRTLPRARRELAEGRCAVAVVHCLPLGSPGPAEVAELTAAAPVPLLAVVESAGEPSLPALLEAGAAEVLPASLSPREMVCHLRALLRRRAPNVSSPPPSPPRLQAGALSLDVTQHRVTLAGRPLELPRREFALLQHLLAHAEQACRRTQLWEAVWGGQPAPRSRTLDVHIARLRSRLGPPEQCGVRLTTVPGVGYRLEGSLVGRQQL